ncbi:MAG: hypothetical protein ACJ8A4_05450 [Microvirga sp.]
MRRERGGATMTAERENFQPGTACPALTLYDFWSSSSAYRVRIALAI